ncbi:DUF3291 domain-containing protein [Deinococcus cellulosilyticus]|uniref:DUF3291 domain-containing protein n=1 Tax=Deinococcus cellulosilyticus (strain DSM 18568 / NBRC 106333 / KACC 11606 / 5516J-15) TaxID=1223518 RepID=A0A511N4T7_DEIC1|nr:DUF3291 domain-containing protein [Deinococcus cellulosilyticus]GEM47456.1 hypothetical protein DC3_30910 [Deinococcus cellulosilyticus NBRC 106333 = KACC 11606]
MQLAQVNIARLLAPIDSPQLADFVSRLDEINALAENTPGFVWRLTGEGNDATSLRPYEDEMIIVNMSVWQDIESLKNYVYKSDHTQVMKERRKWFENMKEAFMVLWWIEDGHIPTVLEARDRLEHLRQHGPTPHAFTFRQTFAPETAETPLAGG